MFHLPGDAGGMAAFCERYADSFHRWWDDLGSPQLDDGTVARLVDGLSSVADTESMDDLVARRDALLQAVIAAKLSTDYARAGSFAEA
jgi:carnitine 3-dehydrogenase